MSPLAAIPKDAFYSFPTDLTPCSAASKLLLSFPVGLTSMKAQENSPNNAGTEIVNQTGIPPDWLADFEAAARRPLETRFRYAFIRTYKPVLDDAPFRAFETTADYRRWCEENLPDWLGYARV